MLKEGRIVALDSTANLLRRVLDALLPARAARRRTAARAARAGAPSRSERGGTLPARRATREVETALARAARGRRAGRASRWSSCSPTSRTCSCRSCGARRRARERPDVTGFPHAALQGAAALLEGELPDRRGAGADGAALPAHLRPRAGGPRAASTAASPTPRSWSRGW